MVDNINKQPLIMRKTIHLSAMIHAHVHPLFSYPEKNTSDVIAAPGNAGNSQAARAGK